MGRQRAHDYREPTIHSSVALETEADFSGFILGVNADPLSGLGKGARKSPNSQGLLPIFSYLMAKITHSRNEGFVRKAWPVQ